MYAPHAWLSTGPDPRGWCCALANPFCGKCSGANGVKTLSSNVRCCLVYYFTFNEDYTQAYIQPSMFCCPRAPTCCLTFSAREPQEGHAEMTTPYGAGDFWLRESWSPICVACKNPGTACSAPFRAKYCDPRVPPMKEGADGKPAPMYVSYLLKKVLRPKGDPEPRGAGNGEWVEAYRDAFLAVMRGGEGPAAAGGQQGLTRGQGLGHGPPTLVFTRGWGAANAAFGRGGEVGAAAGGSGAAVAPSGQDMGRS